MSEAVYASCGVNRAGGWEMDERGAAARRGGDAAAEAGGLGVPAGVWGC